MSEVTYNLLKVFEDADRHREVAQIIIKHRSTNCDIRDRALENLDLSVTREILDLGCGFGFFTETLQRMTSNEIHLTGIDLFRKYEGPFLESCQKCGFRADFLSDGVEVISSFKDNSFDLVLSSYAMYFFPGVLSDIARILKPSGVFITITHMVPHMVEFTTYIRNLLSESGVSPKVDLPYESLIDRFSDQSAPPLLKPYFRKIFAKQCRATLSFGKGDQDDLIRYFNFKESFFIPSQFDPEGKLHQKVVSRIRQDLDQTKKLVITKNDIIFICKEPLKQRNHEE